MLHSSHRFFAASVLTAGACAFVTGCGISPEDAGKVWSSIEGSLDGTQGGFTQQQALTVDVDATDVECENGGSMSFAGTLDRDVDLDGGITATSAFDYEVTFDQCQDDDDILDGTVHYTSIVDTAVADEGAVVAVVYGYQGTVAVSGERSGLCDFDVEGRVDVSSGIAGLDIDVTQAGRATNYQGRVCGHDADTVIDVSIRDDD